MCNTDIATFPTSSKRWLDTSGARAILQQPLARNTMTLQDKTTQLDAASRIGKLHRRTLPLVTIMKFLVHLRESQEMILQGGMGRSRGLI